MKELYCNQIRNRVLIIAIVGTVMWAIITYLIIN